jgi:hypothetical protein
MGGVQADRADVELPCAVYLVASEDICDTVGLLVKRCVPGTALNRRAQSD